MGRSNRPNEYKRGFDRYRNVSVYCQIPYFHRAPGGRTFHLNGYIELQILRGPLLYSGVIKTVTAFCSGSLPQLKASV